MEKRCYYPDGGEIPASEDHVPCDPSSTGHSACCRSDAVCLTNGLCYQQDSWGNRLGRCGCTDSSWQDSHCADVCTDGQYLYSEFRFDFCLRDAVYKEKGLSIFLAAPESIDGNFCCGDMYNGTSCPTATHGSYEPITLPRGLVLYPNTSQTLVEYGIGRANVTQGASNGTYHKAESSRLNTTALATGTSLGVALLVVIALLLRQCARTRSLLRELDKVSLAATSIGVHTTEHAGQTALPAQTVHEKAASNCFNAGSELCNDTLVSEMPFNGKRQELQG